MVKIFSKALGNRFQLTSKLISSAKNKKIDYRGPSIKWTLWKGNDILLKVDEIHSLLRKSPWQWLLANRSKKRWKKRGLSKITKIKLRFHALPMDSNLCQALKAFNLFIRLLENETIEMLVRVISSNV